MDPRAFVVMIVALALAACGGGDRANRDTEDDTAAEVEDAPDTGGDVPRDEEEEEPVEPGCGNGVLESGEVCDDGNSVNEPCDTSDEEACLADCSLLVSACGNGIPDEGEQCDDGNEDTFDDCTTSCTDNGHTIGDPCWCDGPDCNPIDLAMGSIHGCENAEMYVNVSRELACMRSVHLSYDLYFGSGYCTLMAFHCEGDPCTTLGAREIGDIDTFVCPAGNAQVTRIETIGAMIVTVMTCHPICESPADCRWNADEDSDSPFPGCARYDCVERGDGGEYICLDPRNPA